MKKLLLILPLIIGCNKEIQEVPTTTTVNNSTTTIIEYVCNDHQPFPFGDLKIKCKSKKHCEQVCK